MIDRLGSAIKPGSLLTYASRSGSSLYVTDVVVERVDGDDLIVTAPCQTFVDGPVKKYENYTYKIGTKTYKCRADRGRMTVVVGIDGRAWLEATLDHMRELERVRQWKQNTRAAVV